MERVLLLAIALAACKGGSEPTTAPAPAPARTVSTTAMFRHEVLGLAVHDALVRGDVEGARRNARDLAARATIDGGSAEVVEGTSAMRAAAEQVAAAAMGALAQTCADCHARLAGPVRLEAGWPPRREPDRRAQMLRHAWAMNALWDGLIGNSEPPWREGAAVLADPAIAAKELVPKKTTTPEIDALRGSVEHLGARAAAASDTGVRATIYGELLATCADCHARAR
ncbi:MAG: hypothetical protein KIT84_16465 [Labilithrix sp.]|nr:hypothetical protein [Labilithrix sp.]